MNSRRSWVIFWVGVVSYMIAILQRASLGVAGVAAVERFDAAAAALSSMAVMQLVVYAAMQVPIGVLIDRLGPRVLIVAGLAFMAGGQFVLAAAPTLSVAVLGRVLVGAGDAAVFVSVLRLVASWFSGKRVPQLSQWVGNLGQLGQVLSAVPFAAVLHTYGWSVAFASAASLAVFATVLSLALLRDRPEGSTEAPRVESWGEAVRELRAALRRPGTRLGFWSHFVTQSPGTVISLFWGYPFMVYGLGYSEQSAAMMLLVLVLSGMVTGPLLGLLSARWPLRRSNIVLGLVSAMGIAWISVLVWPGQPPLWLVIILLVALGAGGPGSLIGFDFARTYNPSRVLGSANGVVNVGGFSASFIMMFLIGIVIDALGTPGAAPEQLYTLDSFKLAFLVPIVVVSFGVVMLLLARRSTRARMAQDDGVEVGPVWVALMAKIRRERPEGGETGRVDD